MPLSVGGGDEGSDGVPNSGFLLVDAVGIGDPAAEVVDGADGGLMSRAGLISTCTPTPLDAEADFILVFTLRFQSSRRVQATPMAGG
ncbi:MAG: hypothetical protein JWN06_4262 [Propionibacteriaceae bacterium]|jgi:hypothetical protein|nr:hypothetical protein [Propionibacteriaceae bacterium]